MIYWIWIISSRRRIDRGKFGNYKPLEESEILCGFLTIMVFLLIEGRMGLGSAMCHFCENEEDDAIHVL